MKRERIIDLGELLKSFWKASDEVENDETGRVSNADLNDIDMKVWDEANSNIKNIEKIFAAYEKENKKENKRRNSQSTKTNVKDQENDRKNIRSQVLKDLDREIGE